MVEQIPAFIERIAAAELHVPVREYPLREIDRAWEAASQAGERVVVVPG